MLNFVAYGLDAPPQLRVSREFCGALDQLLLAGCRHAQGGEPCPERKHELHESRTPLGSAVSVLSVEPAAMSCASLQRLLSSEVERIRLNLLLCMSSASEATRFRLGADG